MITTKFDNTAKLGRLFMVATPIGNLQDVSNRCMEILSTVKIIGCENINRTKILLDSLNISYRDTNFIVLNDPREYIAIPKIVDNLYQGNDVACVSDAGTPLVSDPGFELIRRVQNLHFQIIPIPGPSSITTLLSVCPIPTNEFKFVGYLPRKSHARKRRLFELSDSRVPSVFFEVPQRVVSSLEIMLELDLHEHRIFVGRELTKRFEEFFWGTVAEVYRTLKKRDSIKGEFISVLDASAEEPPDIVADSLIEQLLPHLKNSEIARIVSVVTYGDRKQIYQRTVSIREQKC